MGHERSFDRLYRRHRRAVYGSVLRDVRDPDEAEDVTQVAFLNAFRAMSRGDEPERPRAWLITIARNVVRRRARLRASGPQEVELDPDLAIAPDDVESSTAADIYEALRGLPENQRHAIALREIQGRSYAEIAEALELSVAAVETLIFRARRSLAAELEFLDRTPVVQRREQRKRGLLALPLPGFARLGELGLSFGRAGAACAVGCTVIVTLPLGSGGTDRAAAAPEKARPAVSVAQARPAVAGPVERPVPHKEKKAKTAAKTGGPRGGAGSSAADGEGIEGGSVAGVQLPQLPLPPVTPPALPVEPPALPPPPIQLPPPIELPPAPLLTS